MILYPNGTPEWSDGQKRLAAIFGATQCRRCGQSSQGHGEDGECPDRAVPMVRTPVVVPRERPVTPWRQNQIEIAQRNIANGIPDSRWCGDRDCDLNGLEHGHGRGSRHPVFMRPVPRQRWWQTPAVWLRRWRNR